MLGLTYKLAYRYEDIKVIKNGGYPFPKSLTIFPTEVCNLACLGCHSKQLHGQEKFMDYDLFKEIVKDFVKKCNGKAIAFEGGGEPMLHPQIQKFIDFAYSQDLEIGMITNGTVYHPVLEKCNWVRVSLNADDRSGYLQNTGKDLFDKVVANIKMMVNNKRKANLVGVKFLYNSIFQSKTNDTIDKLGLDYVDGKQLCNSIFSSRCIPEYVKPCGLTLLRAVVDYDGTFYVCPFFHHYKNTDIGKGVLSKVWGSNKHREAISNIKNCNLYDCPMLNINLEEVEKANLNFI